MALMLVITAALVATGCSRRGKSPEQNLSKRVIPLGQPVPKGGGRYKVGSPYNIGGRTYYPAEQPGYDQVGVASWYGEMFHGRYTANGEIYDMDALTAAHPTLPLPTYARVTNLQNGRSLVVRVNDRGPYAHDRIIDMSRRSAHALGFQRNGTARVRVQYLGRAPLNGDDSLERRIYASQPWAQHASLDGTGKQPGSPTRLAKAVRNDIRADPMAVGSLPSSAGSTKAGDWTTDARSAHKLPASDDGGMHVIQAASFTNQEFADTLRQRLAELGTVRIAPVEVGGRTWYRVRLGPYRERHDADEALRAVIDEGITDARIVRN